MASLLAPYRNAQALAVARQLDDKVMGSRNRASRMMSSRTQISRTVPTHFLELKGGERYAYRRFGSGSGLPLLLLQHFTGTLDNWDPALTDALAGERELILFDNAGLGHSSGAVPTTMSGMAKHAATFLDGLGIGTCDVLGFSLGGMFAQQMVLDRPTVFRRLILVGTAPRGGEDIMHLEKPRLAQHLQDPSNKGYGVLQKIFFTLTPSGQAAGAAFLRAIGGAEPGSRRSVWTRGR